MPKKKSSPAKEMSFTEHLDELRSHLIRATLGIVVSAVFLFMATDIVFRYVLFAPLQNDFLTYRGLCALSEVLSMGDQLCYSPPKADLRTFDMGEAFVFHLQFCLVGGLILSFPYVFYEFWRFVSPGLYNGERRSSALVVFVCSSLFLLGVCFGYFVLSPFSISFLIGYELPMINSGDQILKVSSYMSYMVMFTLPVGIAFELPIVVFFLTRSGLISADFLRRYRRQAVLIILVSSAFITPPDAISQIVVGAPIYILYELSIGIAARQDARRAKLDL